MSDLPGFAVMCEAVEEKIQRDMRMLFPCMDFQAYKRIMPSQYWVVPLPRVGEHDVFLDEIFGAYMRGSDNGDMYDIDDTGRFIHSVFQGPCGRFMVFASRYNFNVQNMSFSSFCEYDTQQTEYAVSATHLEGGPRKQHVYILGVPLRICSACAKPLPKSYKCSRCRAAGIHARYCSKQCQVAHWPVHRAVCGGRAME